MYQLPLPVWFTSLPANTEYHTGYLCMEKKSKILKFGNRQESICIKDLKLRLVLNQYRLETTKDLKKIGMLFNIKQVYIYSSKRISTSKYLELKKKHINCRSFRHHTYFIDKRIYFNYIEFSVLIPANDITFRN